MADLTIANFNSMTGEEAVACLKRLCGAAAWCHGMSIARPVESLDAIHRTADRMFDDLGESDWREAFAAHPKLGDLTSLRMKYAGNREWSGGEQAGVGQAAEETLRALARLNAEYEAKFGYIFILCATGKSAAQMLEALRARLPHAPEQELPIAVAELRKITHLRIDKLFT